MARTNLGDFLRRLTRGMAAEGLADQSDRQLVERFLADRNEAVFEAIVRRHGPMVYRVCWRVLQQEQDAEDAFQATFLLLARDLRSLRKHTSLASWLHGVAHRVALKARAQAAARRRHEKASAAQPTSSETTNWEEWHSALDDELSRMPDRWRLPLILCYLESRTQDEAAEQLGWSKSTLRRRLDDARAALARRLSRRGCWPAALSVALLSDCVATALSPLVATTVEAATRVAAGQAAAVVPPSVLALMEGVRLTVSRTTLKMTLALLLACSIISVAHLSASSGAPEPPPPTAKPGAVRPAARADALAGPWLMTLPAGFAYTVNVRPLGANCYAFDDAVRFSGVYELRKDRLVIIRGTGLNEKGYEWELRKPGEFVLVAQPPISKTGANYLGATLRHLADGQEPPPKQRKPAPGQERTKPAGNLRDPARVAGRFKFKNANAEKASPQQARSARALEQIKATYRLKKEPVYRAPPQYCLLLLGGQDPARLWMVSDGATLYVDRNGNGDLTEPGEAIPFRAAGFAAYFADPFPGGGAQHRHLHIAVRQRDWKTNTGGYWSARIEVKGRYAMYAFAHKFAKTPQDAPVIHLGGPLRMGLEEVAGGRLLRGRKIELTAHVISQYPGTEKTFIDVDQHCPKDVHPIAEIVLPPRTPGGKSSTLHVPLTRRC